MAALLCSPRSYIPVYVRCSCCQYIILEGLLEGADLKDNLLDHKLLVNNYLVVVERVMRPSEEV